MKEKAFTLVEVIASLGIFALISLSVLTLYKLNIDTYSRTFIEQSLMDVGEEAINSAIEDLKEWEGEIDSEGIEFITKKYSNEDFKISISPLNESLYLLEVNYLESGIEGLCCLVYLTN